MKRIARITYGRRLMRLARVSEAVEVAALLDLVPLEGGERFRLVLYKGSISCG